MSIRTDRLIQIGIFLCGLLIGGIIYANLYPIGIGASTDGAAYLMAAHSFANGKGFLSYDATPLTWWPPLYPALLGALHRLTGANLLSVAFWVNAATFVAILFTTQLLARRLFPDRPALTFWAVLMAAGTHVMVAPAQNVGTDYLAAFLALPAIYFAGSYIQQPAAAPWAWLLVFGTLSGLQRYNGVTVIGLAGLVVFFATPGSFWRKAAWAAGQGAALIPLALWGLRNIAAGTGPFGYRVPPINGPVRNVSLTLRVLMDWFVPEWLYQPHPLRTKVIFGAILLGLAIALAAVFIANRRRLRIGPVSFAAPVVGYSVLFLAALIVNASVTYFKDINTRFLVPVYIPLILTGLVALDFVASQIKARLPKRAAVMALVSLLVAAPVLANWNGLEKTPRLIAASRVQGVLPDNMYVNRQWQQNPAVAQAVALKAQYPQAVFYSNLPAGIAMYTWSPAYWSPLKFNAVFEKEFYPLQKYEVAFKHCNDACFLVWMLPHPYEHMYLPSTLRWMVSLEEVFRSEQGIIYRIGPPAGQAQVD